MAGVNLKLLALLQPIKDAGYTLDDIATTLGIIRESNYNRLMANTTNPDVLKECLVSWRQLSKEGRTPEQIEEAVINILWARMETASVTPPEETAQEA